MPDNYAFYFHEVDHLTEEFVRSLAPGNIVDIQTLPKRGLTYTFRWPDCQILVSEMPKADIALHLVGFQGWIRAIHKDGLPDRAADIIERIGKVKLVVGFEMQPAFDESMFPLLFRLSRYSDCILFTRSRLLNPDWELLLAPDGTFDVDLTPAST